MILLKCRDHQGKNTLHTTQRSVQNNMQYPYQYYIPIEYRFHPIPYCNIGLPDFVTQI